MFRKMISLLLCAAMLLCLGACGSSKSEAPEAPESSTVKADVQDYLEEQVDSSAKITVFEITADELDDDAYTAIATAYYDVNGTSGNGTFTVAYELDDDEWKCNSISADIAAAAAEPAEPAAEPSTAAEPASAVEEPAAEPSEEPAAEVVMSDNLLDCTFMLDDVVYQLPFAYTDFTANGWTISYGGFETDEVDGESYTYLGMVKDGNKVTVYVYNPTGNTKQIKDCKIGGIKVSRGDIQEWDYFIVAQGFTTDSTQEEIEGTFGSPNKTYDNDTYVDLKYTSDTDEYNNYAIFTINDDPDYTHIELRNFAVTEDDATETDETVPDYLADYTAPTALGDDITSGNIQINGDLYRLDCPVSAFLDNGWTISRKSGAVAAGDTDSIDLAKDGVEIYCSIKNYAKYQTTPENCAVYNITISTYNECEFVLPGGIKIGSTEEEIAALATNDDWNVTPGDTYSYYSPYDSDDDFNLYCSLDEEDKTVDYITIGRSVWDY